MNGTIGFCRVGFSKTILPPPYIVTVNEKEVTLYGTSNNTHVFLYFEYNHSTQTVKIIPESTSLLILSLVMIATLSVAILHTRKDIH